MILKDTYEQATIHDTWEAVYRDDPLKERLNDRMLSDALKTLGVAKNALFLDAGCGVGDHAIRLCRFGLRGIGLDISGTILQRAQERAQKAGIGKDRLTFQRGCLEALPFGDHSFDLVHCRGVLMHVPDWQAAFKELCRVLAPGGALIVFEGNSRSVERTFVTLIRRVRKSQFQTRVTYGGSEDWSMLHGTPFLCRAAHTRALCTEIETHGLTLVSARATNLMDTGLVPRRIRSPFIRLNGLCYRCRLPVRLGAITLFMAAKR